MCSGTVAGEEGTVVSSTVQLYSSLLGFQYKDIEWDRHGEWVGEGHSNVGHLFTVRFCPMTQCVDGILDILSCTVRAMWNDRSIWLSPCSAVEYHRCPQEPKEALIRGVKREV